MFLLHVHWGKDCPSSQLSRWGKFPLNLFLWKAKQLLGMEGWESCYYTWRDKASRKCLAAHGSYTSFSAITSILACFFVPPTLFLLIVTWGLLSRKGEPETACLEAWEGRKEQLILSDWKEAEGQRADMWLGLEWHKGGRDAGCRELRRNTGLISLGRMYGKKSRISHNRFNVTSFGESCLKSPNWEHSQLALWK